MSTTTVYEEFFNTNTSIIDSNRCVEHDAILHRVIFAIILTLQIPSIFVCLVIFIYYATHRDKIHDHNKVLLVLLGLDFVYLVGDLPLPIKYYQTGCVTPATSNFCMFWTYLEFSLNDSTEFVMAAASMQRHMLVFHSQAMRVKWKRYLYHHIPLAACILWPPIFYLGLIIFYQGGVLPSDVQCAYDYTLNLCGYMVCYFANSKFWGTFDWALNNFLPAIVVAVANVALIIRVVMQRRRRHQANIWHKQRRMTIQLTIINALFMITWLPCIIVGVVQILYDPTFLLWTQTNVLLVFIYLQPLLMPFVSLGLLPDVTDVLLKWIRWHSEKRANRVGTLPSEKKDTNRTIKKGSQPFTVPDEILT